VSTCPFIAHNLRRRATIDIDDQRNLSTRLPSWREKQLAVEFRAIFSLKFKSLGSVQAKIIYISRIPDRATRPACVACRQPRRCKHGREIVNVPLAVVRKRRFMCSVFARNSLELRTNRPSVMRKSSIRLIQASGVLSVSTLRDRPECASTKYKFIESCVRLSTSAHSSPSRTHPKRGI